MKDMLRIEIHGADKSGKGHMMALIAKLLREQGLSCMVQGEDTV